VDATAGDPAREDVGSRGTTAVSIPALPDFLHLVRDRKARAWPLALCLVLWGLADLQANAAQPLPLSSASVVARSPRIAAEAGGDCIVAWIEERPGETPSATLVARRRQDGLWSKLRGPAGGGAFGVSLRDPAVALDSAGDPHMVWVTDNGTTSTLHYAFLTDAGWTPGIRLRLAGSRRIEQPVLALWSGDEAAGRGDDTFVVWQESEGTRYQIHAFVVSAEGEGNHQVLEGEDALRYAIFPDLVELPPLEPTGRSRVAVCWYDLEKDETRVAMRVWNSQTKEWAPAEPPAWPSRAVESIPFVAATADAGPFLVGHQLFGRTDRIFLSSDVLPLACVDDDPFAQNRFPRISRPLGGLSGLVWEQRRDDEITVARAVIRPALGERVLLPSDGAVDSFLAPEPDIALTHDSALTVWVRRLMCPPGKPWEWAEPRYTPAVFFSETQIPEAHWQPILPATREEAE